MEKEPESMAVTMKQDYAASEVYSTSSEAPPAYKLRQANSVKIAKIIALTVILSSFILGSFILASTYLQAKASCDQMQALDAVLDKELMLEAMQQELPKAEALIQGKVDTAKNFQSIDRVAPKKTKKNVEKIESDETTDRSDSSSDSDSYSDESSDMNTNRVHIKLPLDLDLSDLANSVLQNNQKSRMNCVIERRRTEEFIDAPSKTMNLPFGVNLTSDPKKQKITGEKMAIFCETGNEQKNEDAEPVRQMLIPIPPQMRTFGPITHMPQQMPPQPMMHQMLPRPNFPPQMMNQQMPPIPAQIMQAPRPDSPNMIRPVFAQHQLPAQAQEQQTPPQMPQAEVRIHLQRIQLPEPLRQFLPPQLQGNGPNAPEVQVREIPIELALQKIGMSPNELKDIQEIAAHKFAEQLRELIGDVSDSDENDSSDEDNSYQNTQHTPQEQQEQQLHEQQLHEQQLPKRDDEDEQPQNQILQMGRSQYARSLMTPISLPVRMMQVDDAPEPQRPHYVQPRSVRSVDSLLHREKRVKRCACDCSC